MEESEKRRERLKAMRMEAAQAEVGGNVETSEVPVSLSNPLLENSTNQPVREESYPALRFDYYTDPMSAVSSNKKRDQLYNQDQETPEMSSFRAHQLQSSASYDQRMYQPGGPFSYAAAYGSPRGMASPASLHQGAPEAWNESRAPTGCYSSAAHGHRSPFPTMHQGSPEAWNVSAGTPSYNSPSNAAGCQFFCPGCAPVSTPNFNFGQGRPHWYGSSPSWFRMWRQSWSKFRKR